MSAPRVKGGGAKRSRDATRERTAAATNKAVVNKGEPIVPASQAATQEGHVRPEMVRIVADSAGVPNLSADVGQLLAPDVEYRLREIIQEAVKFMNHSKRSTLTTDDINAGLQLRNVEPLYGFGAVEPLQFSRAQGHNDVFYVQDRELDVDEVLTAELPRAPVAVTVTPHWLAVEGVQPAIPENPTPAEMATREAAAKRPLSHGKHLHSRDKPMPGIPGAGTAVGGLGSVQTEALPVASHVLSKELQLYYERVTSYITGTDERLQDAALKSVASDPGLHALLPYFTQFLADEVTTNLKNLPVLASLMRCLHALLLNPHHNIEPYLHQLMPTVLTCMVAKRLSKSPSEPHWALREYASTTLALICTRYGGQYPNIQPRVTRTLVRALLDPARPLPTHYGAIVGLAALGARVVKLLLLPNVPAYLALLLPELDPVIQPNELKRTEAMHCLGALQAAAGACMFQHLGPPLVAAAAPTAIKAEDKATVRPTATASTTASGQTEVGRAAAPETAGLRVRRPKAPKPTAIRLNAALKTPRYIGAGGDAKGGKAVAAAAGAGAGGLGMEALGGASATLTAAWREEDAMLGPQLEALQETFGEGLVPFVPTASLASIFC